MNADINFVRYAMLLQEGKTGEYWDKHVAIADGDVVAFSGTQEKLSSIVHGVCLERPFYVFRVFGEDSFGVGGA